MDKIKIGNKIIGNDEPLYFIADIAANHDGDLQRAFKLIELAKEAGADAAKFQNFLAPKIVSKKGFENLQGKLSHQASWKKSVYEVYEDASVPYDWTSKLKEKCDSVGIEYFTSPYDIETVDYIDKYVNAFKIGSGDITYIKIIEHMLKKNKPLILATGASPMEDVKRAVDLILSQTNDLVLMQCNTNYTAQRENYKYINLNVLKEYRGLYLDVILGLSDHTHGHATVLGAIAFGARVFEKHFTDDNSREGPDHKFAMNPVTWKEMVSRANELYDSLGDGIKKIELNEKETFFVQRRGLRYTNDLKEGHIIKEENIIALRPLSKNGIQPFDDTKIIGKKLIKDVYKDNEINWEDITSA
jgi:sialic acid synthase SpsE